MVRIDGLGRHEGITTIVRDDSDGVPPRLKVCAVDILGDARYSEIIDAARRFIFWPPFQHSIGDFGSEQVMPKCGRRLFMFCCCQIFLCRFKWRFRDQRFRQLRRPRFYNCEMRGASATLEQQKGQATSGENLPAVRKN